VTNETPLASGSEDEKRLFAPRQPGEPFPRFWLDGEALPGEVAVRSTPDVLEGMGSKQKHWRSDRTGRRFLVKFAREGTGEHWAEKLAAEIAELLEIPHPPVEIGVLEGKDISLTLRFGGDERELIHGNELLVKRNRFFRRAGPTIERCARPSIRSRQYVRRWRTTRRGHPSSCRGNSRRSERSLAT